MRHYQLYEWTKNKKKWFHRTTADRINDILNFGLKINSDINLTTSGNWSFEIYGCSPIFLSMDSDLFYKKNAPILIEVNINELFLVADLPSLVDFGAYYDFDDEAMWFENSNKEMLFDDLLDPYSIVAKRAIRLTKTAACLTDISPNCLRLVE